MSLQLQEERGCDSGRAGADDGDAARRNDATRREPTDRGVGHYWEIWGRGEREQVKVTVRVLGFSG